MSANKVTCEDCSHIRGPIYTEFTLNYFGPLNPDLEWHFCPIIKRDWRNSEASGCGHFTASGKHVQLQRRKPSEEVANDRWIAIQERRMMEQQWQMEIDAQIDWGGPVYGDWDGPDLGDIRDDGTPYGWDPDE